MPTKPELEQENEDLKAQLAELKERLSGENVVESDMPDVSDLAEEFLRDLDEFQLEIHEHRFSQPAYVRAYAWARIRHKNDVKASLVYADSHEQDFERSDQPVVKRD